MTWQPRPELNHLYPDQLRERAEADDLAVHPPAPAATEATESAWRAEDHTGHGSPCEQRPDGSCAGPASSPLRDLIADVLLDHLSRTADVRPCRSGELAFMPEVTDAERMRIADKVATASRCGCASTATPEQPCGYGAPAA